MPVAAQPPAAAAPPVAAPNSLPLSATYDVRARIYWARHEMLVSSTATVTNTAAAPVKALTFNLAALVSGRARVLGASVGKSRVEVQPKDQTIVVTLPKPLAPGGTTRVTIRYRGHFNAISDSHQLLLGQVDNVLTAYRWIPWLSRRERFAAPNFGETWVTAVSPKVTVTLVSNAPLVYATSGERVARHEHSQTFSATNVRDFNFSASPDYHIRRLDWDKVPIRIYYLKGSADALMQYARSAMQRFSTKIGPYAYPSLNIAEAPIGTGMESPALAWLSATAAPEDLERLVAHEIAHQWFYAAVGNNQARQPFADEAVATFLADDLVGSFHSSLCAAEPLDLPVYEYGPRCYPEVIYNQGARYLDRYRTDVGNKAFWAGMSQYYAAYQFQIGGTRRLLDALDATSGYDSLRHANRFPSLYP